MCLSEPHLSVSTPPQQGDENTGLICRIAKTKTTTVQEVYIFLVLLLKQTIELREAHEGNKGPRSKCINEPSPGCSKHEYEEISCVSTPPPSLKHPRLL